MLPNRLAELSTKLGNSAVEALRPNLRAVIAEDTRRELEAAGVILNGHFETPAGDHCNRFYSFAKLPGSADYSVVRDLLALRVRTLLATLKVDVVVAHGSPMFDLAEAVARGFSQPASECHRILAQGVKRIDLFEGPHEVRGKRTLVLLDVINSGATLDRIVSRIRRERGQVVAVVAIVDSTQYQGTYRPLIRALVSDRFEVNRLRRDCASCRDGQSLKFIDGDTGDVALEPPAAVSRVYRDIDESIATEKHFWKWVRQTGALERHRKIGNTHLMPAISLRSMLRDPDCRRWLTLETASRNFPLFRSQPWSILALPNRKRSEPMAELVGNALGSLGVNSGRFALKYKKHDLVFADGGAVDVAGRSWLLVDTGACSGNQVELAVDFLRKRGAKLIACLVLLDRTTSVVRDRLSTQLNSGFHCVFKMPFRALEVSDDRECPHCWRANARRASDLANLGRASAVAKFFLPIGDGPRKKETSDAPLLRLDNLQSDLFPEESNQDIRPLLFAVSMLNQVPRAHEVDRIRFYLGSDDFDVRSKRSLVHHLPPAYVRKPEINRTLFGLSQNNISATYLESVCMALARNDDFSWLTEAWVRSHRTILLDSLEEKRRPAWCFIAFAITSAARKSASERERLSRVLKRLRSAPETNPIFRENLGHLENALSPL